MNRSEIVKRIELYYSEKIKQFGPVPQGVDWNGLESQSMRFDQLTKLINIGDTGSLLDYGCGYGALLSYLKYRNVNLKYTGYDISSEMIDSALQSHSATNTKWTSHAHELLNYDYVIASGVFNVREETTEGDWEQYILETLVQIDKLSLKGFAFNLLTSYSEKEKMKSNLFYANPAKIFDYCKSTFSKSVALLHDYPLYEFTILVRKNIL